MRELVNGTDATGKRFEMAPADLPILAGETRTVAIRPVADEGKPTPQGLATTLAHHWSLATALAFLAWYVFAPQCVATIGVVRRETNSLKWTWIMVAYMFGLAYLGAFITYRVAVAMGGG